MFKNYGNSKENQRAFGRDYSNINVPEPLGSSAISESNPQIMTQMETFELIKGIKEDLALVKRAQEVQSRQQ